LLIRNKYRGWAYVEQLAFFAAEFAQDRTQGGGKSNWDAPRMMDSEAIVKLRQRVTRGTMMRMILRNIRDYTASVDPHPGLYKPGEV
jgi:hypothetical protein